MNKLIKLTTFIAISVLLSGCFSNNVRYPNTNAKNVTINLEQGKDDRGGFFTSVEIVAGVNDVTKSGCDTEYKGFIDLKPGKNKLGLKPGKKTYILVEVAKSSHSHSSSYSRGTVFTPKKGVKYEIDVNYVDSMFDFRFYEKKKSKRKQLKIAHLPRCKK